MLSFGLACRQLKKISLKYMYLESENVCAFVLLNMVEYLPCIRILTKGRLYGRKQSIY